LENNAMTSETTATTTPELDRQTVLLWLHPLAARGPFPPATAVIWRAGLKAIGREWQRHEHFLREQAAQLGIKPEFPGKTYFAECCALELPEARP
jgi:hypothetical protein